MARIRKLRKDDGDSSFSLYADRYYKGSELYVVPSGKRAYMTVHCAQGTNFAAFSGQKTLRKLAREILKATR